MGIPFSNARSTAHRSGPRAPPETTMVPAGSPSMTEKTRALGRNVRDPTTATLTATSPRLGSHRRRRLGLDKFLHPLVLGPHQPVDVDHLLLYLPHPVVDSSQHRVQVGATWPRARLPTHVSCNP